MRIFLERKDFFISTNLKFDFILYKFFIKNGTKNISFRREGKYLSFEDFIQFCLKNYSHQLQ